MAVKRAVLVASLATISYLLMFLSLPIIPIVPWMKVDFSDIPILIGIFILGFNRGILIAVIRSFVYMLISGFSIGHLIGVFTNLLATFSLIIPIYLVLSKEGTKVLSCLKATVIGTISLTLILSIANWAVITPLYVEVLGMKLNISLNTLILYGVVPFNMIKGILVGTLFTVVYHKMYAWMCTEKKKLFVG